MATTKGLAVRQLQGVWKIKVRLVGGEGQEEGPRDKKGTRNNKGLRRRNRGAIGGGRVAAKATTKTKAKAEGTTKTKTKAKARIRNKTRAKGTFALKAGRPRRHQTIQSGRRRRGRRGRKEDRRHVLLLRYHREHRRQRGSCRGQFSLIDSRYV